jgi:hypothetical protein
MKKFFAVGLFLLLGVFSVSAQSLPTIRIVNNTGYDVCYIFISPSDSEEWGDDFLEGQILSNGESFTARLNYPLSSIDTYDVGIEDESGDIYTKFEITVTNNLRIEFTSDDLEF